MFRKKGQFDQSVPLSAYQPNNKNPLRAIVATVLVLGAGFLIAKQWQPADSNTPKSVYKVNTKVNTQPVNKKFLRKRLTPYVHAGKYPSQIHFEGQTLNVQYTFDADLQQWAEKRLSRYNPDYASMVLLEPSSGKILAMASSRRDGKAAHELPFKATYPGASTFKLITAVAALEEGIATPSTKYSFNGKSTTLYKKQVFNAQRNKWTRDMSLTTAFAKSVNPIFGRMGAEQLGGTTLLRYAEKYGYNAQFTSDFDFDNGSVNIDVHNDWNVVEAASGYTRANTLSPVHGAAIAASIVNGGQLIPPSIVENVRNSAGKELYQHTPPAIEVISEKTSRAMKKLMRATVKEGSGRKTLRKLYNKKAYNGVIAGAKTGHLSGKNPEGRYDWIIGYGERGGKQIAFAVMCINKEKWYVKSGDLAREALEFYFKEP